MVGDRPVEIDCIECQFCRIVTPDDKNVAGEVLAEHGRETGHQLSINVLSDD